MHTIRKANYALEIVKYAYVLWSKNHKILAKYFLKIVNMQKHSLLIPTWKYKGFPSDSQNIHCSRTLTLNCHKLAKIGHFTFFWNYLIFWISARYLYHVPQLVCIHFTHTQLVDGCRIAFLNFSGQGWHR